MARAKPDKTSKADKTSKIIRPVRDAAATQAEILAAAEAEFARQGFTAARTEAIAAQTGVAKSMIYYYSVSQPDTVQSV